MLPSPATHARPAYPSLPASSLVLSLPSASSSPLPLTLPLLPLPGPQLLPASYVPASRRAVPDRSQRQERICHNHFGGRTLGESNSSKELPKRYCFVIVDVYFDIFDVQSN